MKKSDLLEALKNVTINNGPKKTQTLVNKNVLIDSLKSKFTPKADGKGELLAKIKGINSDLAKPAKNIKFESAWKPARTTIRAITERVIMEAKGNSNQPNAFRLNIDSIVMTKHHSKFSIIRGGNEVIIEMLYPNAKDQISIKLQIQGTEDRLLSVDLEDSSYRGDFGAYILKHVDDMIADITNTSGVDYGIESDGSAYEHETGMEVDSPAHVTGYSPVWESTWRDVYALIEADEEEDIDINIDDVDLGDNTNTDVPDDGDFSEDDFSVDASGDVDMGDFGADFGGDFGGDSAGGAGEGDINSDDEGIQGGDDEDTEYTQFREKDDWLQDSLITMQKLIANSTSDQMQGGSGVILTSDEVLNGTTGISTDSNYEIIDKFLKIYPELDGIDITVDMLDQIEDKLSLNDDQFDTFLQQKLPEISGAEDVNDVLNNDMFNGEIELGGEKPQGEYEKQDFDTFLDGFDDGSGEFDIADEESDEDPETRRKAEMDIGGFDLNEFPNLN